VGFDEEFSGLIAGGRKFLIHKDSGEGGGYSAPGVALKGH
jgi:hypothetical protein